MTEFSDKRVLPYPVDNVYAVVADVEQYPEFLPWCTGLRVMRRNGPILSAEMRVAFRNFREQFSCRVRLSEPHTIKVSYVDGPFRYLENTWHFTSTKDGGTEIDFHIDFEFRNRALQSLIGVMFDEAVQKMVKAFEDRTHHVNGAVALS